MSTTLKIVIGVVVVIILAGGGYWYWSSHQAQPAASVDASMNDDGTLPSGSDTSDASLDQDSAAIDAQMQGLDSDSASANADATVGPQPQ